VSKVGHLLCFFGNVTVERLFFKGENDMKLSSLSSLGLAALLLAGTATAASALDFNFSFSSDCGADGCSSPANTPGTVTGEITGLKDNATSAATHVWIDSAPFALGLTTPFEVFAGADTNSFTVLGGQITDALYVSGGPITPSLDLNAATWNTLASPEGPPFLIVGNTDGLAGVTFTPELAPVPETSTWAMLLVGFAGLAFAGYRAKAKTSLLAA
jgi:hypothetical protein